MYPVLAPCWPALLHLKHAIPAADAEKPNCVVRVILLPLAVRTIPRLRPAALAQADNPRCAATTGTAYQLAPQPVCRLQLSCARIAFVPTSAHAVKLLIWRCLPCLAITSPYPKCRELGVRVWSPPLSVLTSTPAKCRHRGGNRRALETLRRRLDHVKRPSQLLACRCPEMRLMSRH